MANIIRNFLLGRMNKDGDERIVPQGEYLHAENVRVNSSEGGEMGVVENAIGNELLVSLEYNGQPLSDETVTISSVTYPSEETIYWLVHDPNNNNSLTGKVDMIVSYDVAKSQLQYHVISVNDGDGVNTTLNFNPTYLITGINIIDDLIFFTDGLNPPRKINRHRYYPLPVADVDGVRAEEINLIVAPPTAPPVVTLVDLPLDVNYIEEVFPAFSYRYRYKDNEYSATSIFTAVTFQPGPFSLDRTTYLNDGMINRYNGVEIEFNTGSEDVVGIDLCYKLSDENQIWVLDKYIKAIEGWGDNQPQKITFSKSKLYTALPSSEILRRFDNVPLKAKAQTTMGNRLVFGNYYDGNELVDVDGQGVQIKFSSELVSNDIGVFDISTQYDSGEIYLDPAYPSGYTVSNNILLMNFDGVPLSKGSAISISVNIAHDSFSGNTSGLVPDSEQDSFKFEIIYNLKEDFSSPYALATSDDFIAQIGVALPPIQPVSSACNGVTVTDRFNCAIVEPTGYDKFNGGVLGPDTGFRIITAPSSPTIGLEIPCMQFDRTGFDPPQYVYEYYKFANNQVVFTLLADQRSLHSNWDYEVGIEYLDDYDRATTVLTSQQNTIHVPVKNSVDANNIRVTIPPVQKPPYWATRYRFLVRPSKEGYNTIYADKYYRDEEDDTVWIKLDGESQNKVEIGDRLIVKSDSEGAREDYVNVAVLNKKVQLRDFIADNEDSEGNLIIEETGAYMQMRPNNFAVEAPLYPVVGGYTKSDEIKKDENDTPYVQYPLFEKDENGDPVYLWDIPSGSVVTIKVKFRRADRRGRIDICGEEQCVFEQRIIATNDYTTFQDFWESEGVDPALADCEVELQDISGANTNVMIAPVDVNVNPNDSIKEYYVEGQNMYQFKTDSNDPLLLWLSVRSGTTACGGVMNRASKLKVNIKVERADNVLVFETEPLDSIPDLFYEASEVYQIVDGNHMGNVQDQNTSVGVSAISDLSFFNCYSFGNGVESYRIKDSITGRSFKMGERVSSVTAEDFTLAHRYADLTYGGVYNEETNVNKLNEFNGGLLNFKTLEKLYGPVMKLFGRKTDILVLQEDKISYVLQGKNLLSDSTGGGTITSVPEVLGTQIARTEEYGISMNPESFASYGMDKYFTDAKRGVVLMLSGSSADNEQLLVVSDAKMKSWFRTLFIDSFDTQKLGAYDPYMREYVLSNNDRKLPADVACIPCGRQQQLSIMEGDTVDFCIDVGLEIGDVVVEYNAPSDTTARLDWDNLTETGSEEITGEGSFVIPKESVLSEKILISVSSVVGDTDMSLTIGCPITNALTVVPIALTALEEEGQSITDGFQWALAPFTSTANFQQVLFLGGDYPIVSDYREIAGVQGQGVIPASGSTVIVIARTEGSDTRMFDPSSDQLRYAFSNTAYPNTAQGISDLLPNLITLSPSQNDPITWIGVFAMEDGFDYLYLVWDYRKVTEKVLCYIEKFDDAICCECFTTDSVTPFYSTLRQSEASPPNLPNYNACIAPPAQQVLYHNGSGAYPEVNDLIFSDQNGTVLPVLSNGWYGLLNGYAIKIESSQVTDKDTCNPE